MFHVAIIFPFMDYSLEVVGGIVSELDRDPAFCPVTIYFDPDIPITVPSNIDVVISFAGTNLPWMVELVNRGLPIVNCGTDFLSSKRVVNVYVDQTIANDMALDHFMAIGIKRVCYASHDMTDREAARRKANDFLQKAKARELDGTVIEILGDNSHTHPHRWVDPPNEPKLAESLSDLELPAAIFCEDDAAAVLIARTAASLSISVPSELCILGYGNLLAGRFSTMPISSFPMGGHRVGQLAAQLMNEWLTKQKQPPPPAPFDPLPVIVRKSTGGQGRSIDLERVRRKIEDEARMGISVDELAELARVSRKTLINRYRENYGETPSEAIRRIRFEHACSSLTSPEGARMAKIAADCGFSSLTSFTNFFTRQAGIPPRDYREKNSSS